MTTTSTTELNAPTLNDIYLARERVAAHVPRTPLMRHPLLDEAIGLIDRVFGPRSASVDPKEVKRLRAQLEQRLGPREGWDSALLRELFGALWERAGRRRRSADHERLWLNLAGYCVRPGFGYPLDAWRVEQLWTLFDDGIQHVNDSQVWSEWWTLWRRAAGGLAETAQQQALEAMDWLEAAARANGIADKVLFTGYLAKPELALANFDIFAMSSDTEQMPYGLLEAMSAGLPVAATDVGDIKTIVSDLNRSFIVNVADEAALTGALRTLMRDPAMRTRLAASNLVKARAEFSFQTMIAAYDRLFGDTSPKGRSIA